MIHADADPSTEPMLGTTGSLIAIGILICVSALFAGSETALTGASGARMHTLEKEGNRRAGLVNRIREKKDSMIGALMLGNTAVNVLSSALAASLLIKLFGEAGIFYASAAMTILVLIFGEVMPKTYALHHSDKMAMAIAPLMRAIIVVFAPITSLITWIVRMVFRLMRANLSMVSTGHHVEMLRGAIEMHQGPEEETNEQRAMLRSILDLADVEVAEIMTHRNQVESINADMPIGQLLDEALKSPYSRLPVWKNDTENMIGVLHIKTLVKEMQVHASGGEHIDIAALCSEPWFIPDTTTLFDQLQAFRTRREHFAFVVDEYGAYMGIVTLEDILEEIVGEIEDETDELVAGVRKQPNGTYLIEGAVTLRDLKREYDWDLPDEDYSTIAGLILHESQMIPDVGQSFNFFGFRFDILRRQRNQITMIRVTPPAMQEKPKIATMGGH
jgi:Mg2+/Co2+ transporter CorB